jgi:hypothetical protein
VSAVFELHLEYGQGRGAVLPIPAAPRFISMKLFGPPGGPLRRGLPLVVERYGMRQRRCSIGATGYAGPGSLTSVPRTAAVRRDESAHPNVTDRAYRFARSFRVVNVARNSALSREIIAFG